MAEKRLSSCSKFFKCCQILFNKLNILNLRSSKIYMHTTLEIAHFYLECEIEKLIILKH